MTKIHVGTSGWMYDHWAGRFYPDNLPKTRWFECYAKHFDTVELNVTYYRLPPEKTFLSWARKAPREFVFSVKGWGLITHRKKLRGVESNLRLFLSRVQLIGEHLGVVFFQTPPIMQKDLPRLEEFLKLLKSYPEFRFAIEFRHSTWFDNEVEELLRSYRVGFVQFHHPELPCPRWVTSDFVYIRMHGKGILYGGAYEESDIRNLADYLTGLPEDVRDVYVYFNNDANAYAVFNALKLKELLEQ